MREIDGESCLITYTCKSEYNIKMDLGFVGCEDGMQLELAQDRVQYQIC